MTKREIAAKIAKQSGINRLLAQKAVQMVLDKIIDTLLDDGRIEFRDFGVFEVKRRRSRKARNPRTGGSVSEPAKLVVTFKQGNGDRAARQRVGGEAQPEIDNRFNYQ